MSVDFDLIIDNLWVGTCPRSREDVIALSEVGVGAVVNLQSVADLSMNQIDWGVLTGVYRKFLIDTYRQPMVDFDEEDIAGHLPEAATLVSDAMAKAGESGRGVYLHCNAGCERSPTTAVAWLCWHQGLDLDMALALVRGARTCKPYEEMLRSLSVERSSP